MSSREQAAANDGPTPMQLLHSRRKHQLHLRPLTNFVYFLVTRGLFFIGLSVVTRNLYSTFTHIKSEANSVIFSRYRSLHQNQTLDTVTDRGTVVQPLIGEAQLFDIGVTIWARATAEEEEEWRNSTGKKPNRWFPALVDGPIIMARDGFRGWFDSPSQISSPRPMISGESLFVPLHSDIAFKGLQLSDVRSTTVNFSLPRKYFLNERGYPMDFADLKATFIILPVSPSPLEHVKSFSSWIHADGATPKRAWPFPLGSQTERSKTTVDEAVDHLSFVMPLIQLFEAPNPCFNVSDDVHSVNFDTHNPFTLFPHIVSRTHVRIVKETELMNLDLFRDAHTALTLNECGKSKPANNTRFPSDFEDSLKLVTICQRDYHTTGILETLFEVDVPLDDGSTRTEWAYAPYLESSKGGLGPKDFTPVPVWKDCMEFGNPVPENSSDNLPEVLNITWLITYSSVSPAQRAILDSLNFLTTPEHGSFANGTTDSDYGRIKAQDMVDQTNSLFGVHRGNSTHPRRRLFFSLLSTIISIIAVTFDALYWYTRNETAFISVSGTILLAIANLIDSELILQGREAWSSYQFLLSKEDNFFQMMQQGNAGLKQMRSVLRLLRFFFVLFLPLQTIWMLLTALRIELLWPSGSEDTLWGRNLPTPRRMPPTHRERTSERLEVSTLQWRSRIAIVAGLFVAYHAMLPYIPDLIDPLHPELDASTLEAKMLYKGLVMKESIVDPLFVSGSIFQIVLNNSSGFFAGSYKIAAIFKMVAVIFDILQFVPSIVGLPESRGGVDVSFVIYAGMIAIQGWQAVTLPRVLPYDNNEYQE